MAGYCVTMPQSTRKILLVLPSLTGGGAERVAVLLTHGWLSRGHHVSVVTVYGRDHDFFELPRRVERVALDLGRIRSSWVQKITGNWQRIRALRKAIRQTRPDVVISFIHQTNVLTLLASRGLGIPVVVTEHIDPARERLPWRWELLRRLFYRGAFQLVSVSEAIDAKFAWLPPQRRSVIYNPISLAEIRAQQSEPMNLPWPHTLIAVGRLMPQKGFDLLLPAFAALAAEFPDWGLVILGEGSERPHLEAVVEDLNLRGRVRLPGLLHQPYAALKQADLFVLSSRHEGFGNALVEAMACGLPVISTDCWAISPGIVQDGVDGLLVPAEDVPALTAALRTLMSDPARRQQLGQAAAETAKRYDLESIMRCWQPLLESLGPGNKQGLGVRG